MTYTGRVLVARFKRRGDEPGKPGSYLRRDNEFVSRKTPESLLVSRFSALIAPAVGYRAPRR